MIRLDATTKKLQAVLAGAVTTAQLQCIVCYSDKTSLAYSGGSQLTLTNNTTQVDICAAPAASTVRDIDYLSIKNTDTAIAEVSIFLDSSGTDYTLFKATLDIGDQIIYTHAAGWFTVNSIGQLKQVQGTAPGGGGGLVLGTPQATTSGSSKDFTSIPAGTNQILVSFVGVSTNGTTSPKIQLGDAGGIETSGYLGTGSYIQNAYASGVSNFTDGFAVSHAINSSTVLNGTIGLTLVNSSTYTWAASGSLARSDAPVTNFCTGSKSLSDELTQIRVTVGADTFDAGSLNIAYGGA